LENEIAITHSLGSPADARSALINLQSSTPFCLASPASSPADDLSITSSGDRPSSNFDDSIKYGRRTTEILPNYNYNSLPIAYSRKPEHDYSTLGLSAEAMVTDELLNTFIEFRQRQTSVPNVILLNTHAVNIKPWGVRAREESDKIILLLHLRRFSHWTVAVIDYEEDRVLFFDSLQKPEHSDEARSLTSAFLERWNDRMELDHHTAPVLRWNDQHEASKSEDAASVRDLEKANTKFESRKRKLAIATEREAAASQTVEDLQRESKKRMGQTEGVRKQLKEICGNSAKMVGFSRKAAGID
jgi:hypothetical protein